MKYVKLICPDCGATIQQEDDRKVWFCQYCGTRLIFDDEILRSEQTVNINAKVKLDQHVNVNAYSKAEQVTSYRNEALIRKLEYKEQKLKHSRRYLKQQRKAQEAAERAERERYNRKHETRDNIWGLIYFLIAIGMWFLIWLGIKSL